jgi:hypothetical protein
MSPFDREVTNLTTRSKGEEAIEVSKGSHPQVTSMKTLTSLK